MADPDDALAWKARLSKTTSDAERIGCEVATFTVYAQDEDEARAIIAEDLPEWRVESLARDPEND